MRTLFRSLGRCVERGYREANFSGPVRARLRYWWSGAVPAGVITLYFEVEREGDLRKVGDCQGKEGRPPDHRRPAGRPYWSRSSR